MQRLSYGDAEDEDEDDDDDDTASGLARSEPHPQTEKWNREMESEWLPYCQRDNFAINKL